MFDPQLKFDKLSPASGVDKLSTGLSGWG